MSNVIRVKLRRDGRLPGGSLVLAFAEDLDLDELTPRARAFALALHDTITHKTGVTSLDVVFECERTNTEQADVPPRVPDEYRIFDDPDERATRVVRWDRLLNAALPIPVAQWVEEQARESPVEWYPVGAPHRPRVPGWEAGAADRALTADQTRLALGRLLDLGGVGYDTLRRTRLMPPDRYVFGKPQWRVETLESFAARPRELWPVSRIAKHLGLATAAAGGEQMRRWGIPAEGRQPGRAGENLYPADLVQAAHAHRPGRGARTDLRDADV